MDQYSPRELDTKFEFIKQELGEIKEQTVRHNGRMTRMERLMLIVGTTVLVLTATNSKEIISIIKLMI